MPVGKVSCSDIEVASTKVRVDMEVASTKVLVDASKGVDSVYSFTSSPASPITNILVPSLENAMSVGVVSCNDMEVAVTKEAVEASKVPTMRLPDVSRTAQMRLRCRRQW
jgi:hypothetical protein